MKRFKVSFDVQGPDGSHPRQVSEIVETALDQVFQHKAPHFSVRVREIKPKRKREAPCPQTNSPSDTGDCW